MDERKIIENLIEFIEGKTSFDIFWREYKNNTYLQKMLEIKLGEKYQRFGNRTINENIEKSNSNTLYGRAVIYEDIYCYLLYRGIQFNRNDIYSKELEYRNSLQPSYVSIEDEDFLNQIIESAPNDLSKTNQKKWIKDKIKSLFLFDKKPPRWIQDPEWPIVDGKPLVFIKQTKETLNDERVFYTFYNPESGEETIVVQFY
ncbi:MAG: hypothetical protein FWE36_06500 [Erysipelotrichales bacterium]|nr:hypothetical protein [Erysipelotrichales bacterium]